MMRGTEDEKLERRLGGGDEMNEGRRGEDLVEEFADGAGDHDLTEGKGRAFLFTDKIGVATVAVGAGAGAGEALSEMAQFETPRPS